MPKFHRTARAWPSRYAPFRRETTAHVRPASTSSFETVLMDTSQTHEIAGMDETFAEHGQD